MLKRRELNAMRELMRVAADNDDFERAMELRDRIKEIEQAAEQAKSAEQLESDEQAKPTEQAEKNKQIDEEIRRSDAGQQEGTS